MEDLRKEDKVFLKHSLYTFDNEKISIFFEQKGLEFKEEENDRCFPISDDSNSILSISKKYLSELNIDILLNIHVKNVSKINNDDESNKNNDNKINENNKDYDIKIGIMMILL